MCGYIGGRGRGEGGGGGRRDPIKRCLPKNSTSLLISNKDTVYRILYFLLETRREIQTLGYSLFIGKKKGDTVFRLLALYWK